MKYNGFFILIAMLFSISVKADVTINQLRYLLIQTEKDNVKTMEFIQKAKACKANDSGIYQGYYSMAKLLECKIESNLFKKLKLFYEGRDLVEVAINKEPQNVELRYFRYAVQKNIPEFLGYSKEMKLDKTYLQTFLASDIKTLPIDQKTLYYQIKKVLSI